MVEVIAFWVIDAFNGSTGYIRWISQIMCLEFNKCMT